MVKHGGAVLAVEGTYTDRRFNRMYTDGMVIKRRTVAGEKTASARATRLKWPRVCHGRATYAWAIMGGLVVKHWGPVLAVEGTYTDRRFNRMYSWNGDQETEWFG